MYQVQPADDEYHRGGTVAIAICCVPERLSRNTAVYEVGHGISCFTSGAVGGDCSQTQIKVAIVVVHKLKLHERDGRVPVRSMGHPVIFRELEGELST